MNPETRWYRESPWDTLEVVLFWGSKVKGQGRRVIKFILHTRTLHRGLLEPRFIGIHYRWRYQSSAALRMLDGVGVGSNSGIECLLVIIIIITRPTINIYLQKATSENTESKQSIGDCNSASIGDYSTTFTLLTLTVTSRVSIIAIMRLCNSICLSVCLSTR